MLTLKPQKNKPALLTEISGERSP